MGNELLEKLLEEDKELKALYKEVLLQKFKVDLANLKQQERTINDASVINIQEKPKLKPEIFS